MTRNTYRAVFFDLDGTLLPMDVETFLKGYFVTLGRHAASYGYDADRMVDATMRSVNSMLRHEPGMLNSDAFWSSFEKLWGSLTPAERSFFDDFYEGPYNDIASGCEPNPAAGRAIDLLVSKGYPLYLTTMPLFPRRAVENRLGWAGVDPAAFDRITCYDNSTACKPSLDYYRENIDLIGLAPQDILMVGNNTDEDLVAMDLGLDAFLVTDVLINPNGFDIETVKHGSLDDFLAFVRDLPACPADGS